MQKKSIIVSALSAMTLAGVILASSCKKDNNVNNHAAVAGALVLSVCDSTTTKATDSTITGNITADLHLGNTKRYILGAQVWVTGNHTLTIDAGAVIAGKVGDTTIGGVPGGALIITKGSKLVAVGTPANPIVFTSANSGTATAPRSGDWGGIILLGQAPTNAPLTTVVEGVTPPAGVDGTFGGSLPHDNSGILKYVRIEYAGYAQVVDKEINALTLAGVGDGTTIDYVEAFKSNDDSFEWFGGTVNCSHLISVDALDDMFDTDNGFVGSITYALGLADQNRADKSQSNGFESDNDATGSASTPFTHPKYKFVTIAGTTAARAAVTNSAPSGAGSYGRAAHIRRNAEFTIDSSIFLGYNEGWDMDTTLPASGANTISKYVAGTSTTNKLFATGYTSAGGVQYGYTKEFSGVFSLYTMKAGDNDVTVSGPTTILPLFTTHTNISNFIPTSATYRVAGAFPNGTNWTKNNAPACTSDHPAWVRLQ
ncbi:hypothetical protein [Chitinophaga parva]|nr:hypothetical protein [Chitinophaga parva]